MDCCGKARSSGSQKEPAAADAVAGMEDHAMRKVISELEEDERQALLVLADLVVAGFSAGLVVEMLGLLSICLHDARLPHLYQPWLGARDHPDMPSRNRKHG